MEISESTWLRWGTPIVAALTVLMEAGHEMGLVSSEVIVLILAILTAIGAFTSAIMHPEEEKEGLQVFPKPVKPPEPPTVQPPPPAQPQKK